jgi:hypothetical protein
MHSTYSRMFRKDAHRVAAIYGFLLLGILLSWRLHARPESDEHSPQWVAALSFGGDGSDSGFAVKVDRDGNRYVTGSFSGTASFPTMFQTRADRRPRTAAATTTLTSAGGSDAFLAKYDRDGKLRWAIQAGGPEDDSGFGMDFDAEGNIYLTGSFSDYATFHGINSNDITVSGLSLTTFLAKYTSSGALEWVQSGSAADLIPGENHGFGVAVEPASGSVFLTGMGQLDLAFSSSDGSSTVVPGGGFWHMVLVKYNAAGKFQWGETNAATINSISYRVAVDPEANVYVIGWMEGDTTFNSSDFHAQTVSAFSGPIQVPPDFPDHAFVAKYDSNGVVKWVNHLGGYKATATDVALSPDGEVSITGFIGNVDSPGQDSTIVTSQPGAQQHQPGRWTIHQPIQ